MNTPLPVFANPLMNLGYKDADLFKPRAFSAVCARPGVGKTAFLVQMALWAMSKGKNVLHVSLGDPIKKVDLWYQDLFSHIARRSALPDAAAAWPAFLPRRFIMTFRVEGFSVPKLEERLADLAEQQIFTPHVIVIDGIESDSALHALTGELQNLARKFSLPVWISVRIQEYPSTQEGYPPSTPLPESNASFESIVCIEGAAERIHVRGIKGGTPQTLATPLSLDPATLLLTTEKAS